MLHIFTQSGWRPGYGHFGLLFFANLTWACGQEGPSVRDTIPSATERTVVDETPIVFRSLVLGGLGDLYVMAPDGTAPSRLARDGDFSAPRWSPDGESLALRNTADGLHAEVEVMTLDGSAPTTLTTGENPRLRYNNVSWLPDGEEVAYGSWADPDSINIWAVSRWGGEPRRLLAELEGSQQSVVWNPGGESLAYTDYDGKQTADIWMLSSSEEGAEPVNLTEGRVHGPGHLEWSPDGTRIAFSGFAVGPDGEPKGIKDHANGGKAPPPGAEIFVIDVATRELTQVTNNQWDDQTPTWAPDGESLLIASARDGDVDLWLIPLEDPEQAQNLIDDAEAPRQDEMPHWYKPR